MDEPLLIALVKRLLEQDPVDVARLRDVAEKHGLVNGRLRCRAWPKLLAADVYDTATSDAALAHAARQARVARQRITRAR